MSNDIVSNAGEPTIGGLEIANVSGSVHTVGNTTRHSQRGSNGKFEARKSTEVGALGPPGGTGPGGVDTVSGRFIPGVRNNAVMHADPIDPQRVHYVSPDYSARVDPARKSHDGVIAGQHDINHRLGCPTCTVMGA